MHGSPPAAPSPPPRPAVQSMSHAWICMRPHVRLEVLRSVIEILITLRDAPCSELHVYNSPCTLHCSIPHPLPRQSPAPLTPPRPLFWHHYAC